MGIDFTYKKRKENEKMPHWSYSGFNRFREKIANELGINIREMEGWGRIDFTDEQHTEFNKNAKKWKNVQNPIKYLLNHSDCDGQISAKRCGKIAEIIDKAVIDWDDDYDKESGKLLAKAMRTCFLKNTPLIFT